MQVPSASVGRVGRCKSASAVDKPFCSQWQLRNCRPTRVSVASCSENAACEWSQKLTVTLPLADDESDEMVFCRRHQHNTEACSSSLMACCTSSRPVSSYTTVSSSFHTECHCIACCRCTPFARRSGNCPAFTFPVSMLSVHKAQSLDSGLALCRLCSRRFSAGRDSSSTDLVQNCVKSDALIQKSSSVPACCSSQMKYYAAGISFDSLNDTCQAYNTQVNSTPLNSNAVCNDDAESSNAVTQSTALSKENEMHHEEMVSIDYMNNCVSPLEYHKRFEVCSLAADFFNAHICKSIIINAVWCTAPNIQ